MRLASLISVVLFTASVAIAETTPKDELVAASRALAATGNYSWVTTVGSEGGPTGGGAGGAKVRVGPTDGRTATGVTQLVLKRGDNTYEAAFKADRRIINTPRGWRPIVDVAAQAPPAGGRPADPTVVIARTLQTFKAPPAHAQDLVGKVADLMKTGETFTGDLTEEGARSLLPVGGGRSRVSDAKGKITFWTKDGVLVKYEYTVQGTVEANGSRRSIDQTLTTEVMEIGTTKLNLAPEAKLKIS
jgi:hypothetical protein